MPSTVETGRNVDVEVRADGHATVFLRGHLDARSTAEAWRYLEKRLRGARVTSMHIDAGALEFCGGSGIALLRYLTTGVLTPGAAVTVGGLKDEFQRLFDSFTAEDYERFRPKPEPQPHMAEEVGDAVAAALGDLREQVTFVGSITAGISATMLDRKRMRWQEVKRVFETAGANALPIVSLISLLVGLIIAFQSAQPLAQFSGVNFPPQEEQT